MIPGGYNKQWIVWSPALTQLSRYPWQMPGIVVVYNIILSYTVLANLGHIQLHPWLIIIIRVEILNIGVIHNLCQNHSNFVPIYLSFSLRESSRSKIHWCIIILQQEILARIMTSHPTLLKVMAFILRLARTASLSAMLGSSTLDILADRMTHMSHRFTFTACKMTL